MENNQHEIYEYARKRVRQKKRLAIHFVLLLLGITFMFIANTWLLIFSEYSWWQWISTIWVFLFIYHLINVFVIYKFMNKQWERTQIDLLITKQSKKIEKLEKDLNNTKTTTE